jgi:hypothetical protein
MAIVEPGDEVVYVGIGNSDDKLTQAEWAKFTVRTYLTCDRYGAVVGVWYSNSNSEYQNACICVTQVKRNSQLKRALEALAGEFRQDSISWAEAKTSFIQPT